MKTSVANVRSLHFSPELYPPQNQCQIITSLLCVWAPVSSLPMIPYIIPHYTGLHTTLWLPTSKSCEFLTCFPGVVIFIPSVFGIIEVRKLLLYNTVRQFLSHALGWIASETETDNLVESYVLISVIFRALATWRAACLWPSVWQPSLLVASLQVRIMQKKPHTCSTCGWTWINTSHSGLSRFMFLLQNEVFIYLIAIPLSFMSYLHVSLFISPLAGLNTTSLTAVVKAIHA